MTATNIPVEAVAADEGLVIGSIGLGETMTIALDNLAANKLRSLLTALGVIIGVAAVVGLLAIGQGAQAKITKEITDSGANLLTVRSDNSNNGGKGQTITMEDAAALANPANVPAASAVAPEYMSAGDLVAGSINTFAPSTGVTPDAAVIHNYKLAAGQFISAADVSRTSSVVVLGSKVAAKLFPNGDAVGKRLRLNGQSFKVIGVLASKGGNSFGSDDYNVFLPISTALTKMGREQVGSASGKAAVSAITVQAKDEASIELARQQITALLRQRHRLPLGGGADDFAIDNQQDLITALTESTRTMTFYLGAIAAISLIVGGIGIMNTMLMAVRERTREIGLRKAVGARDRDILNQFLIEALAMAAGGGLLGVTLGGLIAFVADHSGTPAILTGPSVVLAVGFAAAVGLCFGIIPAQRASQLDPIVALRYE